MTADVATIRPAARLRGEVRLPGDKSISHRALILATLAAGESSIVGAGDGADVRSTAGVMRALGASVDRVANDGRTVDYLVVSPGAAGLTEPLHSLDCGNSGTSLRLIAGMVAGLPMTCVLDGDDSLRRRPVARIIEPLRSMGATLHGRRDDSLPPLTVVGHTPLRAADITTPVPSAQVKSAILLAGLQARGRTTVREAVVTRDHTERMLRARGVEVERTEGPDGGVAWTVEGGVSVQAITEHVPGDPSAAAFWLVAGAIHPDAELEIRDVGVNPTRRAIIDLLRAMGADIEEHLTGLTLGEAAGDAVGEPRADLTVRTSTLRAIIDLLRAMGADIDEHLTGRTVGGGAGDAVGEPRADLTVRTSALRAIDLGPAEVASAIDEIPILCLAATQARGTTTIRGAGELRHKESDRLAGIAAGLSALGARIELTGDDLRIEGGTPLHGATTDSLDDHRLAMTFAIAGLVASEVTTIGRPDSAAISYPGFFDDLERVRA